MNFRFSPYDFQIKTMTDERYGKNKLGKEYILQDYPLTYDEMEPYYTAFEMALGVAGEPGYFGGKRSNVCHASSGENCPFCPSSKRRRSRRGAIRI